MALRAFGRNEDGSLIIFSLMMFVLMLIIAGISLDIERFETARTKLQNTADASALAAASLTQNHNPKTDIVEDFFAKSGMSQFLEDIDIDTALNASRVTVEADINVPTHFFNMLGIPVLATRVTSVAAEAIGDVEISLVLDVSGSMRSNSKLSNLKTAAGEFVDAMYMNAATGSVSISVVPYSTQVSAGPRILDHFTDRQESHEYSHCLNFTASDFETTALDPEGEVEQTLHFDPWTNQNSFSAGNSLPSIVCPQDEWKDVMVFSENTTALKNYINAFQATNWTSIEIGLKWGAALLDPTFQPIVDELIDDGDVGDAFAGRPAEYDKADGLKVIVVMTDGENTEHYEMEDPYRSGDSFVYVYYDNYDRPYYSIWGGDGEPRTEPETEWVTETEWVCTYWYRNRGRWRCGNYEEQTTTYEREVHNWYLANRYYGDPYETGWRSAPLFPEHAERMTWNELWAEVPVDYFADRYLYDMGYSSSVRSDIKNARNYITTGAKDSRTLDICSAAKQQGVLIYAIGFEAPWNSEQLLKNCATTASHFFDVEGAEISQAFAAIAADIARLRLLR